MISRIFIVTLGLLAGAAMLAFLILDRHVALSLVRLGPASLSAALAQAPARWAWIATAAVSAFALAALVTAVIAGMAETAVMRTRIRAWGQEAAERRSAADWRAAFGRTAVAFYAEAVVADAAPMNPGETGRILVDPSLLLGLRQAWLDRLTLSWSIGPLPVILLGLGAALAVAAALVGDDWTGALAAGFAGWLVLTVARYAASIVLMPFVSSAAALATAAIRPLTPIGAQESWDSRAPAAPEPAPAPIIDAHMVAAALAEALQEPLSRLEEAADRLTKPAAPPPGTETIDDAMEEVRAGIERLLASTKR